MTNSRHRQIQGANGYAKAWRWSEGADPAPCLLQRNYSTGTKPKLRTICAVGSVWFMV